jgi:DNA mismatch repair protein MutL
VGRIRILDDLLIDRIAAGEVVERPASVVKELVENSLDAQARRIEILLEGGGKRSIRVSDDGAGMDRDDAVLALERHATSKLSDVQDLDRLVTLGFRGEALPSIAAVSWFTLRTAPHDGEGTEVDVRAGRIQAVRQLGCPRGTSATVERLFGNVPARRKFLRADNTELSQILRLITRLALAWPGVGFRVEQAGRRLLDAPAAAELHERVVQVLGASAAAGLVPFELTRGNMTARGYAGRPSDGLPRGDAQHLFVNGRVVQDRVLLHAVRSAYGNTMPPGRHPRLVLFLTLDPLLVDVNVHPQKIEVRFRRPAEVHDLARDAVATALAQQATIPSLSQLRPGAAPGSEASVAEAAACYLELRDGQAGWAARSEQPHALRGRSPRPLPMQELDAAGAPVPLAQYRDSYIVAQDDRGLLIVDQHAAHERVLFDRYLAQAEEDRVEVQRLMFPLTVELSPQERILLEDEAEEFRRLGFRVESFGGATVRLDAVPAVAANLEPGALLQELLGDAARARSARASVQELRHRLVTTAACRAAIKVNHALTFEGMQLLLRDLRRTANPTTCPHGRPLIFRVSQDELERAFRRR